MACGANKSVLEQGGRCGNEVTTPQRIRNIRTIVTLYDVARER